MAERQPQNFANHRRIVPLYHIGVFGILSINLIDAFVRAVRWPSWQAVLSCLVALALIGIFFYARIFALTVQDRVIRLEMRLRLAQLLPADLQSRIPELTIDQLCALRFASDAELADLTRRVLTDNIGNRTAIKKLVQRWEADTLRA